MCQAGNYITIKQSLTNISKYIKHWKSSAQNISIEWSISPPNTNRSKNRKYILNIKNHNMFHTKKSKLESHTSYLSFHLHRHSVRLKYFRPKTCYLWQNWIGVKTVNRQIGQKVCVPCMSSSPFEERAQYMWWSSSWPVCVSVVVVITWAANHIEGPPLPDSANIRHQWGFHQFLDQAERSTGEVVM